MKFVARVIAIGIIITLLGSLQIGGTTPTETIGFDSHITEGTGYVLPSAVVIDYYLYNSTGDQTTEFWQNYVREVYEIINQLYQASDIPVYFDVQHIMIFTSETENVAELTYTPLPGDEIDVVDLLESFSTFVDGNSTLSGYEEIQLLSGTDFTNSTAGLAWLADPAQATKGASFYPRSVVQATFDQLIVAKIAAHEIGHNYSATHDGSGQNGNNCDNSAFLMSPFISTQSEFSSCSITELTDYLEKTWFDPYEDDSIPILTDILNFDVAQDIGEFLTITWSVTDDNPGYYTLSIDDIVIVNNERINGTTIEYLLSLDVAGNYSFELNITDLVGHHASDTFIMEIGGDLTPRVTSNGVASIFENETATIFWNITDDGNQSSLILFQDGTIIDSLNFTPPFMYNHTVTGLDPGTYNFTLIVTDELNQTARLETLMEILVLPETTTSIETSPDVTTQTSTSVITESSDTFQTVERTITQTAEQSGNALDNLLSFSSLIWIINAGIIATVLRKRNSTN